MYDLSFFVKESLLHFVILFSFLLLPEILKKRSGQIQKYHDIYITSRKTLGKSTILGKIQLLIHTKFYRWKKSCK